MLPRVAVLMAAYNAERTILQAVNSLLQGTYPCRIYVVDDCSRIPVSQVLDACDPDRIEIIRLERNVGPSAARNEGLGRILHNGHEFIVIMDADDVSHPDRLAKQVAFLAANPGTALVGCWERIIDEQGNVVSYVASPCDRQAIRNFLFFNLAINHPTWMVRADVFREVGGYLRSYFAAEDYEMLRRIARRFELGNVPEFLLDYRLSSGGISLRHRTRQLIDRLRVQLKYFEMLEWRAWAGVARTLTLLVLRVKRKRPKTIIPLPKNAPSVPSFR
jgi:glycosyltransferase involved in cell wall biosynthesis